MKKIYLLLIISSVFFANLVYAQCVKNSLYFDGIDNAQSSDNDHVSLSINGPMSTIGSGVIYTIEAWVKRDVLDNPGGNERIISKDLTYQFRVVNNMFVGEIGTSTVQTPYPADKNWHHLAFVRDVSSTTLKIYIDGQLRATAPDNSTAIANNGFPVCIGARDNGAGQFNELWKGNIRWLRVSKTARYLNNFSPTEILATDNNTLALWRFTAGSGSYLYDLTGSHNGTIVNADWVAETEMPPAPPVLSAQSTYLCAGLSTSISASNCSGTLVWGIGQSGGSISVRPYATTTYGARCLSASGCASPVAEITIQVEGIMPTIDISASPGSFIQKGESVTFNATITNGGATPTYQWRKNGAVVGSNSSTYTDSQLNNGDNVHCILISNAPCRQLDQVLSNEVEIFVPELSAGEACGDGTLSLNDLPYTEIRWKKDGQYVDNPVSGSRGSGLAVAGNTEGIVLKAGSVFVDAAEATYVPSNKGILKITSNGDTRIVIPVADRNFYRSRQGSFYIPYEDRVEKWEIGDNEGTIVAGGNGAGSNSNQLSIFPELQVIQITNSGVIYIADTGNKRIQRWNPGASEGVTVAQGNEVGVTLYVDENENIFTVSNGVVYEWPAGNTSPVPVYSYGNLESGAIALALEGDKKGNLYVPIYSSSGYDTHIYRFSKDGVIELFRLGGLNNSASNTSIVYGLTVSSNGDLYLNTNEGNGCCGGIFKWNAISGRTLILSRYFGNGTDKFSPMDVFVNGNGEIFGVGGDRVVKYSPGSNQGIVVAGGNGLGGAPNQLNYPSDVAQDKQGNVYVLDRNNHRVQRWSPGSSSGVTVAGGNGPGPKSVNLTFPNRFFLDSNRTLYIADGSRVQKWTENSTSGTTIISSSSSGDISSVFVKADTIYIARGGNVEKWAPNAGVGLALCQTRANSNTDIHLDSKNNLYYSYYDQYRNYIFDSSVRRWSSTNEIINGCLSGRIDTVSQIGSVYAPGGIFIDSLNNLYVADAERNKIQKFLATANSLQNTTGGIYTAEVTINGRTLTLTPAPAEYASCESQTSGDWNEPSTWACGHIPLPCELVVIGQQHTVSLSQSVQILGLEIRPQGNLSLVGGNVLINKP